MTDRTDSEIIVLSLDAPGEFGEIFDRHFGAVHGYLARRAGRAVADSASSDVFRIAFETRSRFRTERDSALPWLLGIAVNVLRSHRRAAGRRQRLASQSVEIAERELLVADEPLEAALRSENVRDVVRALDKLAETYREPLLLFVWEELSYRQIAQVLDIPLGTVQSRINTARRKLREQLDATGQEGGSDHRWPERRCS